MLHSHQKLQKAWIVAADMGYGHLRASYPLRHLAEGNEIICANSYRGIPKEDRQLWRQIRKFYEFISRFKRVPIIGEATFALFDQFQKIPDFYPRRDLSAPGLQLKETFASIKKGWGQHLIARLNKKPLPLITTFFTTAFMAEHWQYRGEIYCIICDADISRSWASLQAAKSRIKYFAPCSRVVERLKLYGVRSENIFLVGFPLPEDNVGGPHLKTLRYDLANRLVNLDPQKKYIVPYREMIYKQLKQQLPRRPSHPFTVSFAVGGAGAQRELGAAIVRSLKQKIQEKSVRVYLVAGIHNDVNSFFKKAVRAAGLANELGRGIKIIFADNKQEYFRKFNQMLRATDVLWTKPSELSFYTALGLPVIIAPPIGSQEVFNRTWLKGMGGGLDQEKAEYTNEWLFDWLDSGWLAEAAMQGFLEVPKFGTYNIEKVISKQLEEVKEWKTVFQY